MKKYHTNIILSENPEQVSVAHTNDDDMEGNDLMKQNTQTQTLLTKTNRQHIRFQIRIQHHKP